jgi:hypothetical protein
VKLDSNVISKLLNGCSLLGGFIAIFSAVNYGGQGVAFAVVGGLLAILAALASIVVGERQDKELRQLKSLHLRRHLVGEAAAEVVGRLSPFAAQPFELYTNNDDDSRELCLELAQCLSDAGWTLVGPHGSVWTGDRLANLMHATTLGISINGPSSGFGAFEAAADALLIELRRHGLEASQEFFSEFDELSNRLHILVGPATNGLPPPGDHVRIPAKGSR